MHSWMQELNRARSQGNQMAAIWKLRHHEHSPPKWGASFEDSDVEWYVFQRWLELVRSSDMRNQVWIEAAKTVAAEAHRRASAAADRLAALR